LDPILPDVDCTRFHCHPHNLCGKLLADRNQGYRLRIATASDRGRRNAPPNAGQSVSDVYDHDSPALSSNFPPFVVMARSSREAAADP
jgi:hypothetical protein